VLGAWVNEKKESEGDEFKGKKRIKMVPNLPKFGVSTQGNMKRDIGEFKFKDPAPMATRWGRPAPRFGHPPLGSVGPQFSRVGS